MVIVSQVSYAHELARLWCEDENDIEGTRRTRFRKYEG